MRPLEEFLREAGAIGKRQALRRAWLASKLGVSVRDVRAAAEEARLAGRFIGYSTDARRGGLYVAETDAERVEIYERVRAECIARLRQHRALKRALGDRGQALLPLDNGTVRDILVTGSK